jgi:hypothetical protein
VRTEEVVKLVVSICTKHLIYPGSCVAREVGVVAKPGEWQQLQFALQGDPLERGPWFAPRLVVFTVGIDSPGKHLELDNIAARDLGGRELLANGDFSADLTHWFFTSDRSHLPWHAKNLALHVWFDQGLVGLVLLSALFCGALWRVSLGHAREHPLAPALAGALLGFAAVGLFDSLLDMPRVAFIFYALLLIGLTLKSPRDRPDTEWAATIESGVIRRVGSKYFHFTGLGCSLYLRM